jgi:hypothetical protein
MRRLAVGSLSNGELQLWCTDVNQQSLYTCWKEYSPSDPVGTSWTPWQPFPVPSLPAAYGGISDIAALQGPDGRLTLWCVIGPAIFICRKSTLDPASPWTDWSQFAPPNAIAYARCLLTAVYLPNQCTQLFVSAGDAGLWSTTQLFNINNQNVDVWSAWEQFFEVERTSLAGWGMFGNGVEFFQSQTPDFVPATPCSELWKSDQVQIDPTN